MNDPALSKVRETQEPFSLPAVTLLVLALWSCILFQNHPVQTRIQTQAEF